MPAMVMKFHISSPCIAGVSTT